MEKIKSFRDLNIWKKGIEIVEVIYRITKQFPKEEVYGLTAQMRRAAVSIPANVAEGFSRKFNKEYHQFLYVALGSSSELETQVEIAYRLGYLERNESEHLNEIMNHFNRMSMNLLKLL